MQKTSEAKTVRLTARLTGFENKKYTHRCLPISCARVPYGSRHRALGQQCGGGLPCKPGSVDPHHAPAISSEHIGTEFRLSRAENCRGSSGSATPVSKFNAFSQPQTVSSVPEELSSSDAKPTKQAAFGGKPSPLKASMLLFMIG